MVVVVCVLYVCNRQRSTTVDKLYPALVRRQDYLVVKAGTVSSQYCITILRRNRLLQVTKSSNFD
jgi:hypothetical protein